MHYRGKVISGFRISIPKEIRDQLCIKIEDFYEAEVYGTDKLLITFFKVGKRDDRK